MTKLQWVINIQRHFAFATVFYIDFFRESRLGAESCRRRHRCNSFYVFIFFFRLFVHSVPKIHVRWANRIQSKYMHSYLSNRMFAREWVKQIMNWTDKKFKEWKQRNEMIVRLFSVVEIFYLCIKQIIIFIKPIQFARNQHNNNNEMKLSNKVARIIIPNSW